MKIQYPRPTNKSELNLNQKHFTYVYDQKCQKLVTFTYVHDQKWSKTSIVKKF